MNTSACVEFRPLSGRMNITTTIDDKIEVKVNIPIWDMNKIPAVKDRLQLSDKEQNAFNEALSSSKGRSILKDMKLSKANEIMNTFLVGCKKAEVVSTKPLNKFVDEVIQQPLLCASYLNQNFITITKVDLYDAFTKAGLIKI